MKKMSKAKDVLKATLKRLLVRSIAIVSVAAASLKLGLQEQ